MRGSSAIQMLGLIVGGYLIALGLVSGFLPNMVHGLVADPLVVRALGVSLLVSGGSIGWITLRVSRGVGVVAPVLVSAMLVAGGVALLVSPSLLVHPALLMVPGALAWLFGLMGVAALLLGRWYGRSG